MSRIQLKTACTAAVVSFLYLGIASAQAADSSSTSASTPSQPSTRQQMSHPASDSNISARVEKTLQENNVKGISVKSDMGVVSLKGTVPNEEVKLVLARIVASVDGVQGVETSDLKIKADL